jgi:hypothetical protein
MRAETNSEQDRDRHEGEARHADRASSRRRHWPCADIEARTSADASTLRDRTPDTPACAPAHRDSPTLRQVEGSPLQPKAASAPAHRDSPTLRRPFRRSLAQTNFAQRAPVRSFYVETGSPRRVLDVKRIVSVRRHDQAFADWRAHLRTIARSIERAPCEGDAFVREAREMIAEGLLPQARVAEASRRDGSLFERRGAVRRSRSHHLSQAR